MPSNADYISTGGPSDHGLVVKTAEVSLRDLDFSSYELISMHGLSINLEPNLDKIVHLGLLGIA